MIDTIISKIQSWEQAAKTAQCWREKGLELVFTNGCFDIMHYGHLHYLADARACADRLIVGLNSAASVSRLKGEHRPINDELTRLYMLASLSFVDMVVIFEDDTPLRLIELLRPDVLVKGGDWQPTQIVGADAVLSWGGAVKSLPFVSGYSTTNIEQKILNRR